LNSQEKTKPHLDLEKDLRLTPEDFAAMRVRPPNDPSDLGSYIDWLEAIGAFDAPPRDPTKQTKPFVLPQFRQDTTGK
jgi:hypothetical protein